MGATSFLKKLIAAGRGAVDRRTDELVSLCNALLAESGEYASTALAHPLEDWPGERSEQ